MNTLHFHSIYDWLNDRLDAIVAKEARQMVRSRFVVSAQSILLSLLVLALGFGIVNHDTLAPDRAFGRNMLVCFQIMLHAVCVLCVPLYVGCRLAFERADANADLLFSTTLKPQTMVLGKLVSGALAGLMAISVCAPFMALSYFLRGVSVQMIAFALAYDMVVLLAATQTAIFIASLPLNRLAKALAGAACLVPALVSFRLYRGAFTGGGMVSAHFYNPQNMLMMLGGSLILLAAGGLFFVMSSAMLAPASANRAIATRIYVTACWIVTGLAVGLFNVDNARGVILLDLSWVAAWGGIWCVAILVAGGERDSLGPRMRSQIAAHGGGHWWVLMFSSGAAGGFFWALGMLVLTLALGALAAHRITAWSSRPGDGAALHVLMGRVAVADAMMLGYVLLAGCVRRRFFPNAIGFGHAILTALVLMAFAVLLPALAGFAMGESGSHKLFWAAFPLSPFYEFFIRMNIYSNAPLLVPACVASVLLPAGLACSWSWLGSQVNAFYAVPAQTPGRFSQKGVSL